MHRLRLSTFVSLGILEASQSHLVETLTPIIVREEESSDPDSSTSAADKEVQRLVPRPLRASVDHMLKRGTNVDKRLINFYKFDRSSKKELIEERAKMR